jgi:hypothetical protein
MSHKNIKKEEREAKKYVKIAKKEIKEAERATGKAGQEVMDVARLSKGEQKKVYSKAARNLEKANYTAGESC